MVAVQPQRIEGPWQEGYALDRQTLSSTFLGYDELGHARFDTERSPAGELLYRLKYKGDGTVVPELVDAAVEFVRSWKPGVDILVPIPPSRVRTLQPVLVMGEVLARGLQIEFCPGCVRRTRDAPQLKDIVDYTQRLKLLDGLHEADRSKLEGRGVLLFDDLFQSGATMGRLTEALYAGGKAAHVFALTITRARK